MQKLLRSTPFILATTVLLLTNYGQAVAQGSLVSNFREPKVSITFDDNFASTYEYALPILAQRNLPATLYTATGYVGDSNHMSWDQIREVQDVYGWEIGAHTVNHPELPLLPTAEIEYELTTSLQELQANALEITSFATPFGAYDNRVLVEAMKHYQTHRGFWDRDALNEWLYNQSVLMVKSIEDGVTPSLVNQWLQQAKVEKRWLILVFHEVAPQPDPNYEYTTTTADLTTMADVIVASGIKVVTVRDAAQLPSNQILTDGGFVDGLGTWWSDQPTYVTHNTVGNGRYPDYQTAVKFSPNSERNVHLFSAQESVDPTQEYLVRGYVNADNLTAGEFGFYMDEYDVNGTWISGQWLGLVQPDAVVEFRRFYQPTSASVATVNLQNYLTANSAGFVYLDQAKIYAPDVVRTPAPTPTITPDPTPTLTPTPTETPTPTITPSPTITPTPTAMPTPDPTPTPTITPSPTPTPGPVNLVINPGFEELENNQPIAWSVDNDKITLDQSGATPYGANSILVPSTLDRTTNAHLFSQLISIDPSQSYVWQTFVTGQITQGEFGFYIDEYDAAGNWISGQWSGAIQSDYTGYFVVNYTPTSSQVATVRLQYYVTFQSDVLLHLDDVSLY